MVRTGLKHRSLPFDPTREHLHFPQLSWWKFIWSSLFCHSAEAQDTVLGTYTSVCPHSWSACTTDLLTSNVHVAAPYCARQLKTQSCEISAREAKTARSRITRYTQEWSSEERQERRLYKLTEKKATAKAWTRESGTERATTTSWPREEIAMKATRNHWPT